METSTTAPASTPIIVPPQIQDGFGCNQYKDIRAASGNYFKNYAFLGKGGSGTAYLVQATSGEYKGGLFVLKGLHKASNKTRLQRFLDERAFLKNVSHPNLMRLIDEGEFYGRPFIIQPFMPKTLRQELGGKALPFGKALAFACQLLSALQAMHQEQALHRDIKPENIFVNGVSVHLGDFGLMKKLENTIDEEDRAELAGYCAMPYFYRTPELVSYATSESGLDLRSDIFQLGLVIAEMFSGRNPLARAENLTDPIELQPVAHINGKHAGLVVSAIKEMLEMNAENRISIKDALDKFTGAFETYAREYPGLDYHELHEKFFLG